MVATAPRQVPQPSGAKIGVLTNGRKRLRCFLLPHSIKGKVVARSKPDKDTCNEDDRSGFLMKATARSIALFNTVPSCGK